LEGFGLLDAAVGWVVGLATAFGGLLVYRRTAKRDAFQDHCSSYKERIVMREKEYEQARKGPDKEERRRRLSDLRGEYDRFLEAWQQKQELASLIRPTLIIADAPKPAKPEQDRIRMLADGSARLPPELLSAEDYSVRGNAYYEAGDYEQALEAFSRALDILPNDAVLVYNCATTLVKLKRYGEALKGFDHALQLKPGDLEALNNRAATLGKMERYEDAVKEYNRTLELSPDLPESLTGRGAMLYKLGTISEALKDHDRALELRPDYPEALVNRSSAYVELGRHQEAVEDCNRALLLRPAYSLALYNRACAYSGLVQFPEALQDLQAAIQGDKENQRLARTDQDFEKLRNDPEYGPRFWEIVGKENDSES